MVAAVLLASFVPQWGRSEGPLHMGQVTDVGVFLLFFLHGMGLSTDNLKSGASRWKLHLLVQACTYVLFPLWWALGSVTLGHWISRDLLMGFFYLAVLPSTVSSSVAMTALAPTFLLSPLVWQQILMALAIGSIATAVGIFLTRTLIDGIYRGLDRWAGRR